MTVYQKLQARVRLVRRLYRLQMLMKGLSLALAVVAALAVFTIWGAGFFGFRPVAVWIMRAIMSVGLLLVVLCFIYLFMRRDISDVRVAQFIEERYPHLEDRLVTAMEFGPVRSVSPGILDLLMRDALDKTGGLDASVFVDRKRLVSCGSLGIGAVLVFLGLLRWGPPSFYYGFERLYFSWVRAEVSARWLIQVAPGDVELARGAEVEIRAQLMGFDAPDVRLVLQPSGETAKNPVTMEPEPRGSGFVYLVADVQSSMRYYVEAGGIRSGTYFIAVFDLPRVERIDLMYNYPRYTGLTPQAVENQGDVSAIKGTRVDLKVRVNQPVRSARLVFDDRSSVELTDSGGQALVGSFALRKSGGYGVELRTWPGKRYTGSSRYEIEALEDLPPRIAFTKPLRDLGATNVEEVFSELRAEDDIGVGKVELHYSVNGGPEKGMSLYKGVPGQNTVVAPHTFFLEEFGLQPGDLISYYGKTADNNDITGPGVSASDIYFIQIRPFERKYTQSQQAPASGRGGGAEQALSRQQKEIVTATFRLIRDKDEIDPKEYLDSLKTLSLIQSRLKDQTRGLLDRLKRRGAVEINSNTNKMGEYLETAIGAMEKAAGHLGAQKPEEALPEEQKALQQLMRLESLFREVQISFAQGRGSGDAQVGAEDLAAVLELELNKLKNQYETVQRSERQARDKALEEALTRLRDLARRQLEVNNQNWLRGQGRSSSASSAGARDQQQLIGQVEALRRQLQRLSRERSSPDLARASNRLERTIQEMKRALDQSRRGDGREASSSGVRALQQLEDARKALARGQDAGLNAGIDQAVEESKRLLEEQGRIRTELDRLSQDRQQAATQEFRRRQQDLSTRKSDLADRVKSLGDQIDELSKRARKTERETSDRLNDAAGTIRERKLPERILSGNQLLQSGYWDLLKGREAMIHGSLGELGSQLESARRGLGETREGKLETAVNQARQLAEGLESMRQRMFGSTRQDASGARQRGESRQPSQDRAGAQDLPAQPGQRGLPAASPQASVDGGGPGGAPIPRASDRDAMVSGFGPPTGVGIHRDEDVRQLRRELEQRLGDAGELRSLMNRDPSRLQNLNMIIEALRQLSGAGNLVAPEQADRLGRTIGLLRRLESDISRELAWLARKDGYYYADENEVPAGYRKLVEEYYKALATTKP